MKNIIFAAITVMLNSVAINAQDTCLQRNIRDLDKLIHQNISSKVKDYTCLESEFFIIEIVVRNGASVEKVNCFRKENSVHFKQLYNVINKLKNEWKPLTCEYVRYVVPVFLFFNDAKEVVNEPIEMLQGVTQSSKGKGYI